MSVYHVIDLSKHLNHRLFYDDMSGMKEYGIENTFIYDYYNDLKCVEVIHNVLFQFYFGWSNDNIVCDNQEININHIVNKIHIVGFSYLQSNNTFFEVIYDDETSEKIKVPFISWIESFSEGYERTSLYGNNIRTFKWYEASGEEKVVICFHHIVVELPKIRKVKKIILPDDFLIHIFGMTIEE